MMSYWPFSLRTQGGLSLTGELTLTVENLQEAYENLKMRGYAFIESIQYDDHTNQVHSKGTLKDPKSKGYFLIKIASQLLPETGCLTGQARFSPQLAPDTSVTARTSCSWSPWAKVWAK